MRWSEARLIKNMPVMQATFNSKGPGAVRLHLVPPRVRLFGKNAPGLIFVNGNDIVPVRKSHMILLANFFDELNEHDGNPITDDDMKRIISRTIKRTSKIYYRTKGKTMANDLKHLIEDFCRLAYGQPLESKFDVISIGEYAKYMQGPHRMDLMVSSMIDSLGRWHCNNRCLHCYAAGQKYSECKELPTEAWKKILDKMFDARVTQITFTGGEPTLRKDLPELIKYARYFITRVNTNGIMLTKYYCKKLVDAELDSIQITLYSWNEETHNYLVGNNSWKYTVEGIKNAVEAGLSVSVNTPICFLNSDYEKTLEFIHSLGVRYVSCSSIITTGNALNIMSEVTQLSGDALAKILAKATKYADEAEMEIAFTSPGWVEDDILKSLKLRVPTCGACLSNMAITPDGNVVPCQSWLSDESMGNILEKEWSKIWNSRMCKDIRKNSAMMCGLCPLRKESTII